MASFALSDFTENILHISHSIAFNDFQSFSILQKKGMLYDAEAGVLSRELLCSTYDATWWKWMFFFPVPWLRRYLGSTNNEIIELDQNLSSPAGKTRVADTLCAMMGVDCRKVMKVSHRWRWMTQRSRKHRRGSPRTLHSSEEHPVQTIQVQYNKSERRDD